MAMENQEAYKSTYFRGFDLELLNENKRKFQQLSTYCKIYIAFWVVYVVGAIILIAGLVNLFVNLRPNNHSITSQFEIFNFSPTFIVGSILTTVSGIANLIVSILIIVLTSSIYIDKSEYFSVVTILMVVGIFVALCGLIGCILGIKKVNELSKILALADRKTEKED